MKLSMLSFNLVKTMPLQELLPACRKHGFAAVELRMQLEHAHGVDKHLDAAGRQAVRDAFDDANVEICGLTLSNRFEYPEAEKRAESVAEVKEYIELAADLDCYRVRVFGNDMPKTGDVNRSDVLKYVGECLAELGEFGEELGIEVNLEMHGQFNWWRYALRAVEWAAHDNVGIVYNCDPRDVVGGSIRPVLDSVMPYVRHVHMHELSDPKYPYDEFIPLLDSYGYDGYLSAEIEASDQPERVMAYYSALYRAYLNA